MSNLPAKKTKAGFQYGPLHQEAQPSKFTILELSHPGQASSSLPQEQIHIPYIGLPFLLTNGTSKDFSSACFMDTGSWGASHPTGDSLHGRGRAGTMGPAA